MSSAQSARAHARLSPSGAHRWIECPGSVAACEGIPNRSSSFADEGTAAHTLCEFCLAERVDADRFVGNWIDVATGRIHGEGKPEGDRVFEVTDEMAESVQIYLDFVRPLFEGAEVEVEAKLDLRHIPGMEFGTGDFTAYHPGEARLDVVDFKYGKGVAVEVKGNPQLLTYALGVARRYHNRGLKTIRLAVIQPRCPHRDGPVRTADYGPVELMDFELDLVAAAEATTRPGAPRKAGEWCKFCPAAPACAAFASAAAAVAQGTFEAVLTDKPLTMDPVLMSADALGEALRRAHILKAWLKTMEEHAHAEAMAGRVPTGHKLVDKRATRKWINAATAATDLAFIVADKRELMTAPELKSPAQVEPLMPGKNKAERAKALSEFVESVSTGTNLVPIEDPREASRPDVAAVFAA